MIKQLSKVMQLSQGYSASQQLRWNMNLTGLTARLCFFFYIIALKDKNKRVACAVHWVLTSGVPNQMSLTWSQMAFAADIALDSFRALMTAAPRCCTVWVGQAETAVLFLGWKAETIAWCVPSKITQLLHVDLTNLFHLEAPVFLKSENYITAQKALPQFIQRTRSL